MEGAGIETMQATDFVVARNDLQQCKAIEKPLPDAAALPGDALLVKVTRFAFTANNITYAVLGDRLKYWQLFPAPEGFGNVPVWGFGEVIASKHPGIAAGETLFGYFPMPSRTGRAWRRSITPMRASAAIRHLRASRATIRRCCGPCSCYRSWRTTSSPRT